MSKKPRTYQKNKIKKPTTLVPQTSAEGMFEPRPFGLESQQAPQKPLNLNTELMRAQRYGHNLTQMPLFEPVQPKKVREQPLPSQPQTEPLLQAKSTIGEPGDKSEHETEQHRTDRHRPLLKSHANTINAVQCMMDASPAPQGLEQLPDEERKKREAAATLIQKTWRGYATRKQVQVKSVAPGIIHTRIHRPTEEIKLGQRPGEIMKHMGVGDTYDRLRVRQGAGNGGVIGTIAEKPLKRPGELASGLNPNTAVINGGFFSMSPHNGDKRAIGLPVGKTSHRTSHFPIPKPYRGDYGALNVDDKVGISSGPVLEPSKGDDMFEHERFKHKIPDQNTGRLQSNPLNKERGALTHASDRNPRSAISTFPPINDKPGDAIMHTLTTGGVRDPKTHGATMEGWQKIVTQGSHQYADNKDNKKTNGIETRPTTLNLDGGGSVYMGIKKDGQMQTIASGAQHGEHQRKIPNIIFAGGEGNNGKKITTVPNEDQNPNKRRRLDD